MFSSPQVRTLLNCCFKVMGNRRLRFLKIIFININPPPTNFFTSQTIKTMKIISRTDIKIRRNLSFFPKSKLGVRFISYLIFIGWWGRVSEFWIKVLYSDLYLAFSVHLKPSKHLKSLQNYQGQIFFSIKTVSRSEIFGLDSF